MKVKSEHEVAQSVQLFTTPWTAAYQAPLSMEFPRQEYWSGLPLGHICFLILEKWPFIGDILCIQAMCSSLVIRAICSRGAPMWLHTPFCCDRLTMMDGLVGVARPQSGLLPGFALCGGYCLLLGGARS